MSSQGCPLHSLPILVPEFHPQIAAFERRQGWCASTVPFKYAQKEVKGIVYILSFGIGVAIVRLSSLSNPVESHTVLLAMHHTLCNMLSELALSTTEAQHCTVMCIKSCLHAPERPKREGK